MELSEAIIHVREFAEEMVQAIKDSAHIPPLKDDVEALRTVLAALEWRPIAEAPQDGTEVLLFVPAEDTPGHVYLAGFDNGWSDGGEWVDTHGATVEGAAHFRHIGPLPEAK